MKWRFTARLVRVALSGAVVATVCVLLVPRDRRRLAPPPPARPEAANRYDVDIVREFPHDRTAVTQGLIYRNGWLYESTGLRGQSSVRRARLETGEVLQQRPVEARFFGEGLTEWGGRLIQLTPLRTLPAVSATLGRLAAGNLSAVLPEAERHLGLNTGVTYDVESLVPQSGFVYKGEGWGLTADGHRLILSDGTAYLRFLDPDSFRELGQIAVTEAGRPLRNLNELEFVDGEVYANVWHEDRIAIINLDSGHVTGWIDMALLQAQMAAGSTHPGEDVANGIAYDAGGGRLFVTGKRWPRLFEIRLIAR
jgi:glutaminyl-peptide cyclotransferase